MDGDAAGAIEQRRGIAAMHCVERIVDAGVGRSLEHRIPALDLNQIQAEFSIIGALRLLAIMARIC
jgi:hypothetical protein